LLGSFVYNLGFPGQYYLPETGLYYNQYRTYDPQTGRYIESDPVGLRGGSASTYAYALDNPISLADPKGLSPTSILEQLLNQKSKSQGQSCPDDEAARCKQVKEAGIEYCSDATLPTRNNGFSFWNCLNKYLEDNGCGPGGTPLPQPTPAPPPAPVPRAPNSSNSTNIAAAILAAIAALIGGALVTP
jgi:RHS repeat-associated protein